MTNKKRIQVQLWVCGYSHPQPLPPSVALRSRIPWCGTPRPAWVGEGGVSTASCQSSRTTLKPRPLSPIASRVHGHSCKGCLGVGTRPTDPPHYRVEDGALNWDSASPGPGLTWHKALCDLMQVSWPLWALWLQLQNKGGVPT